MRTTRTVTAALGVTVALALTLCGPAPAHADIAPTNEDAVAVGSGTMQYLVNFLDDGDTAGHTGFNTVVKSRVFSFDATADASGRGAYQGSSVSLANPLAGPTVVLRQRSKPVVRPNGSGAGIAALLNDGTHQIDFVRSSRLPNYDHESDARAIAFGGLHVYQLATDGLQIAVASAATNAPAGLSADEISKIYNGTYKKWGDIPGYAGPAPTHGILPVIPPYYAISNFGHNSGTRESFVEGIKTQTGVDLNIPGVLTGTTVTAEQHDPAAITDVTPHVDAHGNLVTAADVIEPFSIGRLKLIDSAYFGSAPAPHTVKMLTGASPDGLAPTSYSYPVVLYIVTRQNDVTSATPFLAGGTQNLVNTLFGNGTSWYARATNNATYTAAGFTRAWVDKGINP